MATKASQFRGLQRFLLRGPVIAAMVVMCGLALLIASDKYHWGWTEIPVHYRVSFSVEVGGIPYSGNSVVQVTYEQVPRWQFWASLRTPSARSIYQGEAATLRLPDGKVLCLMTNGELPIGRKARNSVVGIANRVFPPLLAAGGRPDMIDTFDAARISGSADIPLDLLPTILLFQSATDPKSVQVFDVQRPEQWLGIGASFLGARIAVTSEPLTTGITALFPWLADAAVPQQLTGRDDLYFHESGSNFLLKGYFF
jgi:hypothetical protein